MYQVAGPFSLTVATAGTTGFETMQATGNEPSVMAGGMTAPVVATKPTTTHSLADRSRRSSGFSRNVTSQRRLLSSVARFSGPSLSLPSLVLTQGCDVGEIFCIGAVGFVLLSPWLIFANLLRQNVVTYLKLKRVLASQGLSMKQHKILLKAEKIEDGISAHGKKEIPKLVKFVEKNIVFLNVRAFSELIDRTDSIFDLTKSDFFLDILKIVLAKKEIQNDVFVKIVLEKMAVHERVSFLPFMEELLQDNSLDPALKQEVRKVIGVVCDKREFYTNWLNGSAPSQRREAIHNLYVIGFFDDPTQQAKLRLIADNQDERDDVREAAQEVLSQLLG